MKHDGRAIAIRHIREAEKRIAQLTRRIDALRARRGMTDGLERERAIYVELVEVSRAHLEGRYPQAATSAVNERKAQNKARQRLGYRGRV